MKPRVLLGLWLAGTACGPSDVVLPNPPDLVGDDALVLAVEAEGEPLRVLAVPADTRPLLSLDLPARATVRITALRYNEPLSALGLREGWLAEVAADRCGARGLPEAPSTYEVVLEDGAAGAWTPIEGRSPALEVFRISGPCPCHRFELLSTAPFRGRSVTGFPDGDGVRLVFGDGDIARLDADGTLTELTSGGAASPPSGLVDAFEGPDGELWVATEREVWRGTPEGGFTLSATVAAEHRMGAIDGGPGAAGFEVFSSTYEGRTLQLLPGPVRVLSERLPGPARSQQIPHVQWRGPAEVLATEEGTLHTVRILNGVEAGRGVMPVDSRGAELFEVIPGVGIIAISELSLVYRLEGLEFDQLVGPEHSPPKHLIPFEGGFLYTGEGGYLQEHQPEIGFCPTQFLADRALYYRVYVVGDRLALIGLPRNGSGLMLSLLEILPLVDDGA